MYKFKKLLKYVCCYSYLLIAVPIQASLSFAIAEDIYAWEEESNDNYEEANLIKVNKVYGGYLDRSLMWIGITLM